MNDSLLIPPFQPGTKEYDDYVRGGARALGIAGPAALTTILAQASPISKTPEGGYELVPPGIVTSAYGGIGAGIPTVANAMLGTNIPHLPGADRAVQEYQGTKEALRGVIPHVTPENDTERLVQTATEGAAGMISPIPGSALAGLPNVVRQAARFVIPTKEAMPVAVPLGAVASPAIEKLAEYAQTQPQDGGGQPMFSFGNPLISTTEAKQPEPMFKFGTATPQQQTDQFATQQDVHSTGTPMFQFGNPSQAGGVDFSLGAGTSGMTLGQKAMYGIGLGAAAWLALKYGGKTWTDASKMFRAGEATRDAADVALNTKFNTELAQVDPLRTSIRDQPLEAPLPGYAESPTVRLKQYWTDPNAVVKEYYDAIASSPNAAKEFEAQIGRVNSNQTMGRIINSFLKTGHDTFSNMTMPSVTSWADRIVKLEPQKQDILNTALFAKDELNTRLILFNKNARSSRIGDIPDDRVNFNKTSSEQLREFVKQAEADPDIKALMDETWVMGRRNLDIALHRGYITQADYSRLMQTRPNYIPSTGLDGRVLHILDERAIEPGSGWTTPPTRAWVAFAQHQDRLFRAMATNDFRNALKQAGHDYQNSNPDAAKIFETKTYTAGPSQKQLRTDPNAPDQTILARGNPAERTFITRTPNGPEVTYVNNSQLYNGIIGPPAWYNIANGMAQNTRRWLQSGVTGELAMFAQQKPFPLINLVRNTYAMGSYAPPETYGGLIDRTLKQRMGRTADYRGIDPTNWVGAPLSTVHDLGAVIAKHMPDRLGNMAVPVGNAMGRGLADTNNPLGKTLRAIKGDQWVDALAQRLQAMDHSWFEDYYQSSALGRQHQLGSGGEGAQGGIELPTITVRGVESAARNPLGNQVPGFMGDVKIPFTNVIIPTRLSHSAIDMHAFIKDVFDVVSNGANSYHFKLNRSNPALSESRLAYESSRLFGRPGEIGTGRYARMLGASIPFFSAGLQGAMRAGEQFVNHPFGFVLGSSMSLGAMALAEIYSALFSGPDHIDHLSQKVDSQALAGNGIIYLGQNTDPNHHVEISLLQDWRPLYPYVLEALSTGLNAFHAREDEDLRTRLLDVLGDVWSHRISNSIDDASLHGVGDFLAFMPPFQMPPIATGIASTIGALSGTNVPTRVDPYKYLKNFTEGHPLQMDNTLVGGSTSRQLPGQTDHDSGLASVDGGVAQALINSFLGSVSGAYAELRVRSKEPWSEFWPDLKADAGQRFIDNTPAGALLWGGTLKQSTRTPLEDNNYRALDRMKPAGTAVTDMQAYGLTRRGGITVQPTSPPKVPTDPKMVDIWKTTGAVYNDINTRLMPMANDIQSRIRAIKDGMLSAQTKRTLINGLADQLLQKHKLIAQRISALESALSMKYGVPISMMRVDFEKPFEQFN